MRLCLFAKLHLSFKQKENAISAESAHKEQQDRKDQTCPQTCLEDTTGENNPPTWQVCKFVLLLTSLKEMHVGLFTSS